MTQNNTEANKYLFAHSKNCKAIKESEFARVWSKLKLRFYIEFNSQDLPQGTLKS